MDDRIRRRKPDKPSHGGDAHYAQRGVLSTRANPKNTKKTQFKRGVETTKTHLRKGRRKLQSVRKNEGGD